MVRRMAGRIPCRQCGTDNEVGFGSCFNCGAPLSAATGIRKGTVLAGRYEILSPLGRGGMGVVYKAHDRSLDEVVAIKLLREDLVATPDLTRRFLSEIKLARRVRHPNVCAIHEYGEDQGTRYIAMEYIEGVNLRQVLQDRGPLPVGEAVEVGAQIARGLSAIHAVGIVHRDLKTPNIMRDLRGAVRLMDFGIAKSIDSESHATATGSILGTPEYMSPEQARGEKVDARSDLYSLGVVVFELLTGRVPFRGETPLGVLMKHIHEEPPWDEAALASVSHPARGLLEVALAKDPAERFQSAAEMAGELESVAAASETGRMAAPIALPPRQRGATAPALYPARAPSPTATQVPGTAVPTRAPQTVAQTGSVAAPPAPPRGKWVAVVVGLVAVAAGGAWMALSSRHPAPPPADQQPGALTAAANLAGPPGTVAPSAGPAAVATNGGAQSAAKPPGAGPIEPRRNRAALAAPDVRRAGPPPTDAVATRVAPPVTAAAAPVVAAEPTPPTTLPPAPPPTVAAAPVTAPPATVAPEPRAAPVPVGRGLLAIQVKPEAEISIDGEAVGRMGSYTKPLTAGVHTVVFTHPRYEPLARKVNISANERTKLVVDLKDEALPRRK
jgi:eukaryotic-like serine/threonine-protein kinase